MPTIRPRRGSHRADANFRLRDRACLGVCAGINALVGRFALLHSTTLAGTALKLKTLVKSAGEVSDGRRAPQERTILDCLRVLRQLDILNVHLHCWYPWRFRKHRLQTSGGVQTRNRNRAPRGKRRAEKAAVTTAQSAHLYTGRGALTSQCQRWHQCLPP
jgi:hypothetical protein